MLSRDKSVPFDAWDSLGLRENVFGNQFSTFGSPGNHSQGSHHGGTPGAVAQESRRETESVPRAIRTGTSFARDDEQNKGTIPMPMFAPSTMSSSIPVEIPQNPMVGQQRQQISELQFDNFPTPASFLGWKKRFRNQVTTCSDFHRKLRYGPTKWRWSIHWTSYNPRSPNFEMLDAKIASALNKISQNSHFKKEGQSRGAESPKIGSVSSRKTDRLHDLRLLSSYWCS